MKALGIGCILIILGCFSASGQERLQKKGDRYYDNLEYASAANIYEKVIELGYSSEEIYRRLANSYYFQSRFDKAYPYYETFLSEAEFPEPEYYYRYAQSLRAAGYPEEAEQQMNRFLAVAGNDQRAEKYRDQPDYLEELERQSGRYQLDTLEFNSEAADFGPSVNRGKLFFTSARDKGLPRSPLDRWSAQPFLDIYEIDTTLIWEEVSGGSKVRGEINSPLHESTTTFSPSGETMYFTTNRTAEGELLRDDEGLNRLRILRAESDEKDRWGGLKEIAVNSFAYSVANPCLSADGRMLFFVSDMPGGEGASDIWRAPVDANGDLGTPVNLGPMVNTESRESFPFINKENMLFFATDGHPGLGGLDVFAVQLDTEFHPRKVYNVGTPLNSPYDDFGYTEYRENHGFFASNRPGGKGSDDIYAFTELRPLDTLCMQEVFGHVFDAETGLGIAGVSLSIRDEAGAVKQELTSFEEGEFNIEFNCDNLHFIRAEAEGYDPEEVFLNDKDSLEITLKKDRILIAPGTDLTGLLEISPVYYAFDSYEISTEAEPDLQKIVVFLKEYPEVILEVGAYTDNRGPEEYNLKLSQKRAEAVVSYIVTQGISPERLNAVGKGEAQPVNPCDDGVPCTADEHAANRRSSYVIINKK